MIAEGGHSGSPLLLMQDHDNGTNIVLNGESGKIIDKKILNEHGYANKLDEI